ncbi:unnamed protein product [Sphagnum balticum]
MLRKTTDRNMVNVARYYYYKTVRVRRKEDNIRSNVRKELDIRTATNYRQGPVMAALSTYRVSTLRQGRSRIIAGSKRSSS